MKKLTYKFKNNPEVIKTSELADETDDYYIIYIGSRTFHILKSKIEIL